MRLAVSKHFSDAFSLIESSAFLALSAPKLQLKASISARIPYSDARWNLVSLSTASSSSFPSCSVEVFRRRCLLSGHWPPRSSSQCLWPSSTTAITYSALQRRRRRADNLFGSIAQSVKPFAPSPKLLRLLCPICSSQTTFRFNVHSCLLRWSSLVLGSVLGIPSQSLVGGHRHRHFLLLSCPFPSQSAHFAPDVSAPLEKKLLR